MRPNSAVTVVIWLDGLDHMEHIVAQSLILYAKLPSKNDEDVKVKVKN